MRWILQTILGLLFVMTLIRTIWRPDVRSPEETGRLLSEVIMSRALQEEECQYWAGDSLSLPSQDVLDSDLRARIWKETQVYLARNMLIETRLELRR